MDKGVTRTDTEGIHGMQQRYRRKIQKEGQNEGQLKKRIGENTVISERKRNETTYYGS